MKRKAVAIILAMAVLASSFPVRAEEVPASVKETAEELGDEYGICPELIEAICYAESSFNPAAKNGSYIGIMQVNPVVHKARMERLGVTDLTDMYGCMLTGTDYLSELFERYEDPAVALMHYGGYGRQIPIHEETGVMPGYVKRVLELAARYERQHNK